MAQYPKHAYSNRPLIATPEPIENLEDIDRAVRSNQDRRKRQLAEAREKAEKSKKRRLVLVAVIAVIVIALGSVIAFTAMDNARFAHAMDLPQREVVVHQGDTIDGIAAENPVKGLSEHELGWVIGEINRGSENMGSPLMPGDRLLVPIG